MMENNGAICVGHRRLLSADRLFGFEQVYVLPCPIWSWYISQPAICPILYLSHSKSHVLMCVCVYEAEFVVSGVIPGQAGPV